MQSLSGGILSAMGPGCNGSIITVSVDIRIFSSQRHMKNFGSIMWRG